MGSTPSNEKTEENKTLITIEPISNLNSDSKNFDSEIQKMKVLFGDMKFANDEDKFKEKTIETNLEINEALASLKKNQLLSTSEFKKLNQTENLTAKKQVSSKQQQKGFENARYQQHGKVSKKHRKSNFELKPSRLKSEESRQKSISNSLLICNFESLDTAEHEEPQTTTLTDDKSHLKLRKKDRDGVILDSVKKSSGENKVINRRRSKNIKSEKFLPSQLNFGSLKIGAEQIIKNGRQHIVTQIQ